MYYQYIQIIGTFFYRILVGFVLEQHFAVLVYIRISYQQFCINMSLFIVSFHKNLHDFA